MRWARSTWLQSGTAWLLIGAMLPVFLAPIHSAAATSTSSSMAVWVRAQLRVPADDVVDAAIDEAIERRTTTLGEFVKAFLDAYEERRPDSSASRVFTERDLSTEALIAYLQGQFTEIGGEAVLLRLRLATATNGVSGPCDSRAVLDTHLAGGVASNVNPRAYPSPLDLASLLRSATPACPQGP